MLSMVIRFHSDESLVSFREYLWEHSGFKDEVREIIFLEDDKIQELIERAAEPSSLYLSIRARGKIRLVDMNRICYLEKAKRSIFVHTDDGTSWAFYGKFDEILPTLSTSFFLCHKSYIVNLDKVESLARYSFTLSNGHSLPVSQKQYQNAKNYLNSYIKSKYKSLKNPYFNENE